MKAFWKIYMGVLTLAVVFLLFRDFAIRKTLRATTLKAQKIVLEEGNGTPVLVMGNSRFCPPPILDGRVVEGIKRKCRGIIFYNSDGDEVGGMIWDNKYFHFSMDRYKEDQVLFLSYEEDGKASYRAGLHLWHYPSMDLRTLRKKVFQLMSQLQKKNPEVFRRIKTEEDLVRYLAKNHPELAIGERLFVGIVDGNPLISFKDSTGRELLRLEIDENGVAKIAVFRNGSWRNITLGK